MKLGSFDVLVQALDKGRVRYLVAGGLAVNAHGYLRFTRDVDLVIQLDPDNVIAAFRAMEGIGYRPRLSMCSSRSRSISTRNMPGRWSSRSGRLQCVSFRFHRSSE